MRFRLASAGIAMVAVVLSSRPTVSAVRSGSQHSMRAMDADGAGALECKEGQQSLAIRAANDTVSFRCGENLILFPAFMETGMQAYASANSTEPVLLASILPGAKFTQSIATQRPDSPKPAANEAPGGGDSASGTNTATYYLTAPELPGEEKTVVFKCSKSSVPTTPQPGSSEGQTPGEVGGESPPPQSPGSLSDTGARQEKPQEAPVKDGTQELQKVSMLSKSSKGQEQAPASEGCVMIINVAKSAAGIAATPIAAASSIALAALALALA